LGGGVRIILARRYILVASESESDTMTPESVAIQVIIENPELTRKYSGGDIAVLSLLQAKALELSAGRVNEAALRDTLMRKLGASV
jgi:hypothetical protein